MGDLTCEKNINFFLLNDIAQTMSGICGISRRQIFNIRKSLLQLKTEEENQSTLTALSKDLCPV